ncbi:DUF4238 domain-containing protein [Nocardia sp. CA2R105]|uniref:DUF4238 domain-containing protein n=1 Tax=Nocardia coffeae TaxID=2873381 RepID=UPI001CA7230C|nr:DUF4238 domain-containing protein [Nocardia coffeae]MBY8861225.1 DUF4238 domain-containing protein [Nocardia coffeae]
MTAVNKWLTDDEIERSKERTRNNPQRTRIHHFVPQTYLRRWTEDGGRESPVLLTELVTGHSDLKSPEEIANGENFYQIIAADVDPDDEPDLWFETHMSRIEDAAARWFRTLDDRAPGKITDPNFAENLAVFVALQSQRTPRARAADLNISAALQRFGSRNALDDRRVLPIICAALRIPYSPSRHYQIIDEILAQPTFSSDAKSTAIDTAIKVWRNHITPHLAQRTWWLATSDDPLLTCDEPVVRIAGPGKPRNRPPDFSNTALVLFPISPHRLLLATQKTQLPTPFELTPDETRGVNLEITSNAIEFTYELPGDDIAAGITVPPLPPFDPSTASNFWEAVLPPPTRWAERADAPSWPLQRWTAN